MLKIQKGKWGKKVEALTPRKASRQIMIAGGKVDCKFLFLLLVLKIEQPRLQKDFNFVT